MPLITAIYDADTTNRRPVRWGGWHLVTMTDLARREGGMGEDTPILDVWSINGGHHEVQHTTCYRDPSDGEVLILWRGDLLEVWRE